jgi:hypothetical protein
MAYCGANGRDIKDPPTATELTTWMAHEAGANSTKATRGSLLKRAYRFVTDVGHRQSTVERFLAKCSSETHGEARASR